MDHYDFSTGGYPPPPPPQPPSQPPPPSRPPHPQRRQNQIQGPRPTALKVSQESHKIKKPPLPPQAQAQQQPVIIYSVSPKPIFIQESDFMAVVQRLTGVSSGEFNSGEDQVSPAARLAALERASPSERASPRDRHLQNNINNSGINTYPDDVISDSDLMGMMDADALEVGQVPGILSAAPEAMLPPVPPGFFSPAPEPSFFNDIIFGSSSSFSPYGNNNNTNNFIVSPSGLLSASNNLLSPLPSPDIFTLLMDF